MSVQNVSSPKSEFRELLECPICVHVFKDPKQLNCGHTFCQSCVDKMTTSCGFGSVSKAVECPHCRKKTPISSDGLPTNFIVGDLAAKVEGVELVEQQAESQMAECVACQKGVPRADLAVCQTCAGMRLCCICAVKGHKEHDVDLLTSVTVQRRRAKAHAYANRRADECAALVRNLTAIRAESAGCLGNLCESAAKKSAEIHSVVDTLADRDKHFSVDELATLLERVIRVNSTVRQVCVRALELKSGIQSLADQLRLDVDDDGESRNDECVNELKTMLNDENLQITPNSSPPKLPCNSDVFSSFYSELLPAIPPSSSNAFFYQPSRAKGSSLLKDRRKIRRKT